VAPIKDGLKGCSGVGFEVRWVCVRGSEGRRVKVTEDCKKSVRLTFRINAKLMAASQIPKCKERKPSNGVRAFRVDGSVKKSRTRGHKVRHADARNNLFAINERCFTRHDALIIQTVLPWSNSKVRVNCLWGLHRHGCPRGRDLKDPSPCFVSASWAESLTAQSIRSI
jgi:hypothetical protein